MRQIRRNSRSCRKTTTYQVRASHTAHPMLQGCPWMLARRLGSPGCLYQAQHQMSPLFISEHACDGRSKIATPLPLKFHYITLQTVSPNHARCARAEKKTVISIATCKHACQNVALQRLDPMLQHLLTSPLMRFPPLPPPSPPTRAT